MPRIRSQQDLLNIMQTLAPLQQDQFTPPQTGLVPVQQNVPYGGILGGTGAELINRTGLGGLVGGLFGGGGRRTRYMSPLAQGSERMSGTPALQAYQFGNQYMRGINPELASYAGQEAGLSPTAQDLFSQIERQSPLRTAAWAEPMRNQLDPEVRQAISAMVGLIPTKLGLSAYYGDLARGVQEQVSPELGQARGYIQSRLAEGIPQDMLGQYRQDIQTGQASRGLGFGQASSEDEAYKLLQFREQQRQSLLGPAMTMGYQTLGMTGFPEMAQIGSVNFGAVGSEAWQQKELEWAKLGTYLGFAGNVIGGAGSIAAAL